jgi:hypothetical protein
MSAGVMTANFNWNIAKTTRGIVGARSGCVVPPTPLNMKYVLGSPIRPLMLSPKQRLKPTAIQTRVITPNAMKLWSIVEMTFFVLTIPA